MFIKCNYVKYGQRDQKWEFNFVIDSVLNALTSYTLLFVDTYVKTDIIELLPNVVNAIELSW